jgi:hypothetical protein
MSPIPNGTEVICFLKHDPLFVKSPIYPFQNSGKIFEKKYVFWGYNNLYLLIWMRLNYVVNVE